MDCECAEWKFADICAVDRRYAGQGEKEGKGLKSGAGQKEFIRTDEEGRRGSVQWAVVGGGPLVALCAHRGAKTRRSGAI